MNSMYAIEGKKILITGGTGFIGGRLVEILKTRYNVDVRVLVSTYANVSRIARFSIDIFKGDLCSREDVHNAVEGCDMVFHCAYGNKGSQEDKRKVNVEGTRNVLAACRDHDIQRLVHLSTIMVYGHTRDGILDENAPRAGTGGTYSDTKLEAEKLVMDYYKNEGVPATILQPTAVYGPYAPVWGVNVLAQLKTGTTVLINNGEGLCNCVYIDDLINAMLLAAVHDDAPGESFIISGDEPVTWREFYGHFERMLGYDCTIGMSEADAIAYMTRLQTRKSLIRTLGEDAEFRARLLETPMFSNMAKAANRFLPEKALQSIKQKVKKNGNGKAKKEPSSNGQANHRPVHPMSDDQIRFFAAKTRFSIDKAKSVLGYKPQYDISTGMNITEKWSEAANLLGRMAQVAG